MLRGRRGPRHAACAGCVPPAHRPSRAGCSAGRGCGVAGRSSCSPRRVGVGASWGAEAGESSPTRPCCCWPCCCRYKWPCCCSHCVAFAVVAHTSAGGTAWKKSPGQNWTRSSRWGWCRLQCSSTQQVEVGRDSTFWQIGCMRRMSCRVRRAHRSWCATKALHKH